MPFRPSRRAAPGTSYTNHRSQPKWRFGVRIDTMRATARFTYRPQTGVKTSGFFVSLPGPYSRIGRHDGAVHAGDDARHDRRGHRVSAPLFGAPIAGTQ